MEHPDTRIVRHESDIVGRMGRDKDGIQPDWTTSQRLIVACQHGKDVSMQVYWMIIITLVVEVNLDQLPVLDHNHTCIRKDLAVHGVGHTHAPKRSAYLVIEYDVIRHIEMAVRRDRTGGWLSVCC